MEKKSSLSLSTSLIPRITNSPLSEKDLELVEFLLDFFADNHYLSPGHGMMIRQERIPLAFYLVKSLF